MVTAYKTFNLKIILGNDAMNSPDDIATALADVAARMERGQENGTVMDLNGNTVGRFGFGKLTTR